MQNTREMVQEEKSPDGRYIRFNKKIGSGSYKSVYLGYDTDRGVDVAWNIIFLRGLPVKERERISNETNILHSLKHPNIIEFYHVWQNKEKDIINFTTEIVSSGTLKDYSKRSKERTKLKVIKKWCKQILDVIDYLHSRYPPIIHRDLKCDNIFINGSNGELKVGDLGLSTAMMNPVKTVVGTPEFMAPEMYEERYDESVDIYAFGMTVLEIVTNEYPYKECSNAVQIYKKVVVGEKPEVMNNIKSKKTRSFIEKCITIPKERLSAKELLVHPFLKYLSGKDDLAVEMNFSKNNIEISGVSRILGPKKIRIEGKNYEDISKKDFNPKDKIIIEKKDKNPISLNEKIINNERDKAELYPNEMQKNIGLKKLNKLGKKSEMLIESSECEASDFERKDLEEKKSNKISKNKLIRKPDISVLEFNKEKAEIFLVLNFKNKKKRNIKFEFYFKRDTVKKVVNEMNNLLNLYKNDCELICRQMKKLLTKLVTENEDRNSNYKESEKISKNNIEKDENKVKNCFQEKRKTVFIKKSNDFMSKTFAEKKELCDFLYRDLNQKLLLYYKAINIFSSKQIKSDLNIYNIDEKKMYRNDLDQLKKNYIKNLQTKYFNSQIKKSLDRISTNFDEFEKKYNSPLSIFTDNRKCPNNDYNVINEKNLINLNQNIEKYLKTIDKQNRELKKLQVVVKDALKLLSKNYSIYNYDKATSLVNIINEPENINSLKTNEKTLTDPETSKKKSKKSKKCINLHSEVDRYQYKKVDINMPLLEADNLNYSKPFGDNLGKFLSNPDYVDNSYDLISDSFTSIEIIFRSLKNFITTFQNKQNNNLNVQSILRKEKFSSRTAEAIKAGIEMSGGKEENIKELELDEAYKVKSENFVGERKHGDIQTDAIEAEERLMEPILNYKSIKNDLCKSKNDENCKIDTHITGKKKVSTGKKDKK